MNYSDPYGKKSRKLHAGFSVGLIGAGIMVAVHLVALLIFHGNMLGDWIAWGIQLIVYFSASQVAAQQHYNSQEREADALRGVRGAGVGAAITVSLAMWIFIIVRDIIMSAINSPFSFIVPVMFCLVVVDVMLAIGLGAWGGTIVEKKYKGFEGYNSNKY